MSDTHTVSMDASELSWDDADERGKKIGFKDRSKYIQYLIEKDIYKGKFDKLRSVIDLLIMLIGFSIIILILLVVR